MTVMNLAVALVAMLPALVFAQTTETDWLEPTEGFEGGLLGAQMRSVERDEDSDIYQVTIAIPKPAIGHPGAVEEVLVIGFKPEESEPVFEFNYDYQWVEDYDRDYYGLVIKFSKSSNWPIRLYMYSDEQRP